MRLWFWCYFALVVTQLYRASPPYYDWGWNAGWAWTYLPSFSWREWEADKLRWTVLYATPYVLSGLLLTLTGLSSAPRLAGRFRIAPAAPFWSHFGATLGILLVYAVISDVGSACEWWLGWGFFWPFLLGIRPTPEMLPIYAQIFLPAPILSGFTAYVRTHEIYPCNSRRGVSTLP